MILQFSVYTAMFVIFYVFPMTFVSIGFSSDSFYLNNALSNAFSNGGNIVSCDKGTCTGNSNTGVGGISSSTYSGSQTNA